MLHYRAECARWRAWNYWHHGKKPSYSSKKEMMMSMILRDSIPIEIKCIMFLTPELIHHMLIRLMADVDLVDMENLNGVVNEYS